jgi:hypothetical protein
VEGWTLIAQRIQGRRIGRVRIIPDSGPGTDEPGDPARPSHRDLPEDRRDRDDLAGDATGDGDHLPDSVPPGDGVISGGGGDGGALPGIDVSAFGPGHLPGSGEARHAPGAPVTYQTAPPRTTAVGRTATARRAARCVIGR